MVLKRKKKCARGRTAKKVGSETVGYFCAYVANITQNWITKLTTVDQECNLGSGVGK